MAVAVFTSFGQLLDANGDPLSGATVTVYAAGTTTPLSIYTDIGLSVAATNPIETDSAGRHDMRYIAAVAYKALVKNSSGVPVFTRDNIDPGVPIGSGILGIGNGGTGADNAPAALVNLGAADQATLDDVATQLATLAGAASSTEKTHIADGTTLQRPASPLAGDFRHNSTTNRWEGYNNSPAIEQFFTDTEIASSGEATAGSDNTKVMTPARVAAAIEAQSAWVFIEAKDASNSATIEFTGLDSTYDAYEVRYSSVKPATDDTQLGVQIGTGTTPTWVTSGSYTYALSYNASGGAADVGGASSTSILLGPGGGGGQGVGNAAGENMSGNFELDDPETSDFHNMRFRNTYTNAGGAMNSGYGGGRYNSAAAITAIRFLFASGNISSGHFVLCGQRRA